ncbi:MAG: hypothetical protein HQ554_06905 [FCB group bacterium]|nr:hypothetical protein [FCB group bacterium]
MKNIKNHKILLLIIIIYVLSILVRCYWFYQVSTNDEYKWKQQTTIITSDGYHYAKNAKDIINKESSKVSTNGFSTLTAFIASILPFPFESIILFLPAFIGSLIVIPLILFGKFMKNIYIGFIAALFSIFNFNLYLNTMAGNYDTNMFAVILPIFFLYFLFKSLFENSKSFLILSLITIIFSQWIYPQSSILILMIIISSFVYSIFFTKNRFQYLKIILMSIVSVSQFNIFLKVFILLIMYYLVFISKIKNKKILIISLFLSSVIILLLSDNLDYMINKLQFYVFSRVDTFNDGLQYKYFNVTETILEADILSLNEFSLYSYGHLITFFLSLIGYTILILKRRIFIISLPVMLFGIFSLKSGFRFSMYLIPISLLSISFLIIKIGLIYKNKFMKLCFISICSIAVIFPNIIKIKDYKIPVSITKSEIEVLDELNKIGHNEDYVISWWDYGYQIQYYAEKNTLSDGGRNTGVTNFPISQVLCDSSQILAANLSRILIENKANEYKESTKNLFETILEKHDNSEPHEFFDEISKTSFIILEKTKDVYYYLPFRMLGIFNTVNAFSNIDILTGKQKEEFNYYYSHDFIEDNNEVHFNNGIQIDLNNMEVVIDDKSHLLKKYIIVHYGENDELKIIEQDFNTNGDFSLCYLMSYNAYLLMDDSALNSNFIQMFVFENYNEKLFKPVILSSVAKVYKLKI